MADDYGANAWESDLPEVSEGIHGLRRIREEGSGSRLNRSVGMIRAMGDEPDGKAAEQLAAIESLAGALGAAGLDYWLFGGWAVDFWVGRVTRDHDDIDAAAWRRDYEKIRAALLAAGWRHTPLEDDVVGTRYSWRSSELEFTFVEDRDGTVVVPFPEHEVVWAAEPFGDDERSLLGVRARVIPLELLRDGKQRARGAPAEAAKDVADHAALTDV